MSAIRRVVSQNAFHLRNVSRSGVKANVARNMSTILEGKERGDEARFIREAEAARAAEIRKNVERIMALNDNDSEKEALVSLVEPKKEPSGFIEKWGLNDWKIAGPVAILTVGPMIESQYLLMDADMMITGAFLLVCGTVYNQAGPMIDSFLKDTAEAEFKALVKADDLVYDQIKAGIDADVNTLSLKEDVASILSLKHDLKVAEAEVLTAQEAHKYRESVVAKLESLQALEDAAVREIRARMISKVQSDVLDTFKNDKKVKENALNQAIAVLSSGSNAKMGKDVVGEVFTQSLQNYKEYYSKQPEGSDPIIKKLQAEIAVIAAAPAVESKGGNVYTLSASASKGHH